MDSKKLNLDRRGILSGFADGRYETSPKYDPSEFAKSHHDDPQRRDNRVSIRVSGHDMSALHRLSLAEGLPLQSLLAQIVHQYANGLLEKADVRPEFPVTEQTAQLGDITDPHAQ